MGSTSQQYQAAKQIFGKIDGKRASKLVSIILPIILFFVSLLIGRYPVSPDIVFLTLLSKILPIKYYHNIPRQIEIAILYIRLPRAIAAVLIGSTLALSGASFQALFRNPLVSSQILGVASGAGFGAALALLLSDDLLLVHLSAFGFGILAVLLSYAVSKAYKETPVLTLVLAGMVVGALFSALTSLIKYVADPYDRLPSIVFWLMGGLSGISFKEIILSFIPIIVPCMILLMIRWRLNVLSLGEEEAEALGVDVNKMRILVIGCCTLMTSAAVSIAGVIGWIGLVIPHVGRMLVGPDHKTLIPVSLSIGASFLLVVDCVAKMISTAEIPLGILTSLIGAPFFFFLLRRGFLGWR